MNQGHNIKLDHVAVEHSGRQFMELNLGKKPSSYVVLRGRAVLTRDFRGSLSKPSFFPLGGTT